jgi:hypothetical protein
MDSKSILRASVILRDAVRNDPAVTGLELTISAEAVLVSEQKRPERAWGCARLFPNPLIRKLYGRR